MKDRKISDVFTYPGIEGQLMVIEEGAVNECYGCVFNGREHCTNDPDRIHTGECSLELRSDWKGVIFVHAEKNKETNN